MFCYDIIVIMVVNFIILIGNGVLQNEVDGDWLRRSREDYIVEGFDEEV